MKKAIFFSVSFMMLILPACAPVAPVGEPTQTPSGPKPFAATLAVANTPIPSQEPTPATLPTFSLATVDSKFTPLPTANFSTPVIRTPLPTITLSVPTLGPGTPETECFVTASIEGIPLKPGPSISSHRFLPTMELSVIYHAIDIHGPFYQLARDGVPVRWVQFISLLPGEVGLQTEGLSTEGSGCDRLLARPDTRPLTDFPGVCLFTATSPSETFHDSMLTQPHFILLSPSPSAPHYVGLVKSQKSIFTLLSHAGPSFFAPLNKVSTTDACEGIPTSATVKTAGWLWSEPDERQGEKLLRLTAGMHLFIEGDRPPDGSGESAWVQAAVEGQPEKGWVWSALLIFD